MYIVTVETVGYDWNVYVGPFGTDEEAQKFIEKNERSEDVMRIQHVLTPKQWDNVVEWRKQEKGA